MDRGSCSKINHITWGKLSVPFFQLINNLASFKNWPPQNVSVNISVIWFFVDICSIIMILSTTYNQKWCNGTDKTFVPVLVQWFVVITVQILLCSNLRQVTLVVLVWTLRIFYASSSSRLTIPITSQSEIYSAIYSVSVVLSVIKYCIFLAHIIGQLEYFITYPVR